VGLQLVLHKLQHCSEVKFWFSMPHPDLQVSCFPNPIDYCSCVGTPTMPSTLTSSNLCTRFATKVITRQWNSHCDDCLKLLNLPRLSTHHKSQKLSLCYRIVSSHSIIPSSHLILSPHLHHNHHLPLFYPIPVWTENYCLSILLFCQCHSTLKYPFMSSCILFYIGVTPLRFCLSTSLVFICFLYPA